MYWIAWAPLATTPLQPAAGEKKIDSRPRETQFSNENEHIVACSAVLAQPPTQPVIEVKLMCSRRLSRQW